VLVVVESHTPFFDPVQHVSTVGYVCGRGYQDILQTWKSPDPPGGHRTTPRVFLFKIMIFLDFYRFFHGCCGET
jgi:hypothetical protein